MKKVILFAAAVACLAFSETKAQIVNGVPLREIHSDYIDISEFHPAMSRKVGILVEYGQKILRSDDALIKDDQNKRMEFNSALDCIDKMKTYGYEFFSVYAIGKDANERHYILKKKNQ